MSGEVEFDEVYIVAGYKGNPEVVKKDEQDGGINARGRGTLEKEKPPIFGMIERKGEVVINMLPNVQQATIEPYIKASVALDSMVYTDEYNKGRHLLDHCYRYF